MASRLTSIDLFSGAGGLSLGLEAAGLETVTAVELSPDAAATYRAKFPNTRLIEGDARAVDFSDFRGIDVVAGGAPCQPFSTGGHRQGRADARDLLPEFVRAVDEIGPRAFILENVPGLASEAHAEYLREVFAPLLGRYRVSGPHVLNAADYGVPQMRRRLILVGMRDDEFRMPEGDPRRRVPAGSMLTAKPWGAPNPSKVVYARNPDLRPNPYHGHLFNGGGRAVDLDAPAPTILASAGGNKTHFIDAGRHVPPYHAHLLRGGAPRSGELPEARRLTVEESAALQGFPAGMHFAGSRSSQYTQIGNAVPVGLAKVVGEAVVEQLRRRLASRRVRKAVAA